MQDKWIVTYLFGVLLATILRVGMLTKWIVVKGWKNFPHGEGGVLLTPNHPSLFEPFLMVALFHKAYLRHPKTLGPYTWADKINYTSHDGWSVFNQKLLTIVRPSKDATPEEIAEAKQKNLITLKKSVDILRGNGNILLFGEGGRTGSVKNPEEVITSPKGNQIRPFVDGAALIAMRSMPKIVPVWVKIDWGPEINLWGLQFWVPLRVHISIGQVMEVIKADGREALTKRIQEALLSLADEAN